MMFKRSRSPEGVRSGKRGLLKASAALALAAAVAAGCSGETTPAPDAGASNQPAQEAPAAPSSEAQTTKANPKLTAKQQAITTILHGTTCTIETNSVDDRGNDGLVINGGPNDGQPDPEDKRSIRTTLTLTRTDAAEAAEKKYDGKGLDIAKVPFFGVLDNNQTGLVFDSVVEWEYADSNGGGSYTPDINNPERNVVLQPYASTSPSKLNLGTRINALVGIQITEGEDNRYTALVACDNAVQLLETNNDNEQLDGVEWQGVETSTLQLPCELPKFKSDAASNLQLHCS